MNNIQNIEYAPLVVEMNGHIEKLIEMGAEEAVIRCAVNDRGELFRPTAIWTADNVDKKGRFIWEKHQ